MSKTFPVVQQQSGGNHTVKARRPGLRGEQKQSWVTSVNTVKNYEEQATSVVSAHHTSQTSVTESFEQSP